MKVLLRTFLFIIFTLQTLNIFAQVPANDDCSNAIPIPQLDGTCNNFDFDESTYDFVNGGCADPGVRLSQFGGTGLCVRHGRHRNHDHHHAAVLLPRPDPSAFGTWAMRLPKV